MSLSNIKVLLLNVNRSGWHSGNMIYDMEVIKRACDTKVYGPGWPDYKYNNIPKIIEQLYGSDKPDIIYSYFTKNEQVRDCYVNQYKIPESLRRFHNGLEDVKGVVKVFALSDFWARSTEQFSKDLGDLDFQYCVSCFTPPYSNPKNFYGFFDSNIQKNIKFLALPRCIDSECFRDYHLPKKYDVVSLGAMWHFYPLRCHMNGYLLVNAPKLNINYRNYPHCGTDFKHSDFVREKYASAINQSKMLISCGGKYHLAFNKIFESMACNTVYVGEKPYGESELNLRDGFNYVAVTRDNFIEKIRYYLDNPIEMAEISKNAINTFKDHHSIDVRARDFVKLMENIDK